MTAPRLPARYQPILDCIDGFERFRVCLEAIGRVCEAEADKGQSSAALEQINQLVSDALGVAHSRPAARPTVKAREPGVTA